MILLASLLGGIVFFLFLCFILSLKRNPKARLQARIQEIINSTETTRLKTLDNENPDDSFNVKKPSSIFGRLYQRFYDTIIIPFLAFIDKIFQGFLPNELYKQVEKRIVVSGEGDIWSAQRFVTFLFISITVGILTVYFMFKGSNITFINFTALLLLGGIIGCLVPIVFLNLKIRKRKEELRRQLPNFMDLLYMCINAGATFDDSVDRVIRHMRGTLADELKRMRINMSFGMDHKNALKTFAERCDLEEVFLFVTSVIQAEKLGTSMSDTLKLQVNGIRERHRQYIQEKMQKASIKILFPLVFLIFPVLLIVILLPAVMTISSILGN